MNDFKGGVENFQDLEDGINFARILSQTIVNNILDGTGAPSPSPWAGMATEIAFAAIENRLSVETECNLRGIIPEGDFTDLAIYNAALAIKRGFEDRYYAET